MLCLSSSDIMHSDHHSTHSLHSLLNVAHQPCIQPRPPMFQIQHIMAAVIVHGGAYTIPDGIVDASVSGCQLAARLAHKALEDGKSALDAVEIAVRCLEDDPTFNAGHGSSLNTAGQMEMDAIIMDGKSLNYGSVAGVRNIANPVSLARMVMERTDHVMLIGQGANEFAREVGVAEVEPEQLLSAEAKRKWQDYVKFNKVVSDVFNSPKTASSEQIPHQTATSSVSEAELHDHDTVGAVALDLTGNLAAATSTGGISLKRVGRVGDAPLVGSGAYCNNELGGVSCTGHGESITKVVLAHRVLNLLQSSQGSTKPLSSAEVVEKSLEFMLQRTGGRGGLIMITSKGDIAKNFTTQRMCWASVDQNGVLESGIE